MSNVEQELAQVANGGSQPARPNRVVVIGDSETFNYSGGPVRQGVQRSGKALFGGWFATQGYTLQQIHDTHLPTVLALSGWQKPAACVVFGGTNDCGLNSGGGAGTGFNFTSSKATHLDICTQLLAAGILPILVAIPPRLDFTLCNTNVRQWNAYIHALAQQKGWPLADLHAAVVSTGGAWLSSPQSTSGDNIHFNGYGNELAANAIAAVLKNLYPFGDPGYLSRSTDDPQNLIPSTARLFLAAPTTGTAGGWNGSGKANGITYTVVSGDASIAGDWQTFNKPQAATADAFLQLSPTKITTGFNAGDRLAFACLYQAAGFDANTAQSAYIAIVFKDGGSTTLLTEYVINSQSNDFASNAVAYDEVVVPTGTATIDITSGSGGAATNTTGITFQIAQPTLYNLTALGLA